MTTDGTGGPVLVTGARGFVGRHLAAALAGRGTEVHATSRGPPPECSPGLAWHRCDLADADQVRALFSAVRPAEVFHLSSLADGRRDRALVLPVLQAETVAAVNVMMAVADSGARRLVVPASLEEAAPGDAPSSPYAAAKTATHLYATMCHRLYQLPVVTARIFMAYGPGQPGWKLIPSVVARLARGESPAIESPDRMLDWIYVADVVDGLLAAMAAPGVEGGVLDLGTGRRTSIRDLVEKLRSLVDPAVVPAYGRGAARGNERERLADVEATRRLTGWAPRVALDDGLERVVAALRQEPGG